MKCVQHNSLRGRDMYSDLSHFRTDVGLVHMFTLPSYLCGFPQLPELGIRYSAVFFAQGRDRRHELRGVRARQVRLDGIPFQVLPDVAPLVVLLNPLVDLKREGEKGRGVEDMI